MHPPSGDHRRHDVHVAELLGLACERVAVEHDEVGRASRDECSARALVVREPGRRDARRVQRLLQRHRFLRPPRRTVVDRAQHSGEDSGPRVELLDRCVGTVDDDRAGLDERAKRVRAVELVGPEPLGEVAVGRRVRELHGRGDADLREARDVFGRETLRVLDARTQTARLPRVARTFERVERVAVRAVADRVHADRPAGLGARAHDLRELVAARDLHAAAVEHQCGLRAERPVHEDLQVADAQQRRSEPAAQRERTELRQLLVRNGLPHAQRQRAHLLEPLPQSRRAEPAVLVVDAGDAARVRELHADAHRVDVLVVGDAQVPLLEPPRRLFAKHAGRLAVRVALDDAAVDVEVAAGERERGRVEPERVVVLRDQQRGALAGDRVEIVPRRIAAVGPVAAAPTVTAQRASRRQRCVRSAHALERFRERAAAVESHLVLRDRPRREVHVRVGEARNDAAAAEVDRLRTREHRLVDADASRDPVAGDGERGRERQRRVERADDAVLEDHPRGSVLREEKSCSITSDST